MTEKWKMSEDERELWINIVDTICIQCPLVAQFIEDHVEIVSTSGFRLESDKGYLRVTNTSQGNFVKEKIKSPGEFDLDDLLQYKDPVGTFEGLKDI